MRHLADPDGTLGGALALSEAGVPEGVREVTTRRLWRLATPAREMLATAAVIGREFDFDVLEHVGPLAGDELVAALDEAVEARVLVEDSDRVGRYTFAHALVRATLYDGLSALRRARLHSRVGEALIARRGAQLDPHLGELAHHFALAAPVDRPERAVDFALAAGRRADRLLAWEEAAGHYRAALRARELAGATDDRLRCELLLALGDVAGARGHGREPRDVRAGRRRRAGARRPGAARPRGARLRRPVVAARARRGGCRGAAAGGARGARRRGLAAARAAAGPAGARALLRGRPRPAAGAVGRGGRAGAAARRPDGARDVPRRAPLRALAARDRARAAGGRGGAAAAGGGGRRSRARARGRRLDRRRPARAGRRRRRRHPDRGRSRLAAALHRPLYEWWTSQFRCAQAQLAGDFEEAERLAGETLAIGRRGQAENAVHVYAQAMFNIRREQGRLARGRGGGARVHRAATRRCRRGAARWR